MSTPQSLFLVPTTDLGEAVAQYRDLGYAQRVPTPPRIVVPPPTLNADSLPDFNLVPLDQSSYLNLFFTNPVTSNALLEWSYERRREAQMVLPYLYLGPMTAAKDRAFLAKTGITMVLGVRQRTSKPSKLMQSIRDNATELGISSSTIDLADLQELIAAFPHVNRVINEHLADVHRSYQEYAHFGLAGRDGQSGHGPATPQMGKVLVFCESGNDRSAAVVAAYLMDTLADVDYIKAMQLCQAQRFCVNFDDGIKRLLQGYWDILRAQRMVGTMRSDTTSAGQTTARGKRSYDVRGMDDDDGDECMGDDMTADVAGDAERFGGRSFQPFVDKMSGL